MSNSNDDESGSTSIANHPDDDATAVTRDESDAEEMEDVLRELDDSSLEDYNKLLIQLGAFPVSSKLKAFNIMVKKCIYVCFYLT